MGTMTIDGRKIEFTDEKNVLSVIRKAGIIIPNCLLSEPVVCVQWKTAEAKCLRLALRSPGMEW